MVVAIDNPRRLHPQAYPLVNINKKLWKDPPFYSWENPLFLWGRFYVFFFYHVSWFSHFESISHSVVQLTYHKPRIKSHPG